MTEHLNSGALTSIPHSAGCSTSNFTHNSSSSDQPRTRNLNHRIMTIRTLQGTIQTELFQEIKYHGLLGIITFSYGYVLDIDNGEGPEYTIQLPMCFKNKRDCFKIFRNYLKQKNEGKDWLFMYGYEFSFPWEAYQQIIEHKASKLEKL